MTSKVKIAREIRDNGYDCDGICACRDCPFFANEGGCIEDDMTSDEFKEAVDNYIKRYDRSRKKPKKSFTTDRPNFIKALKDEKEFYVETTLELSKELRSIERKITKFGEWISDRKYLIYELVVAGGLGTTTAYAISVSFSNIKPNLPEYNPTTDTFTESKFDNEPKKVEPKTLTTHIIKLKSDCVVMTEKEYDRLKKMEEDYNLIKKVLED